MTVADLIEQLKAEDPARVVVMSRDQEGNGHAPLSSWWTGACSDPAARWGGRHGFDVGLDVLTEEDRRRGYGDEDVMAGGVPALILVPAW